MKNQFWQVVIQKLDTTGRIIETRRSLHDSDETATDAMLAASEATMDYEIDLTAGAKPRS